jgi:hypothetical protein
MIRQKDNRDNFLGSAVFMVLFFFFMCAFAGNNQSSAARDSHYKSVSAQHSYTIALNDAQQVSTPKIVLLYLENTNFKLLSDCYKHIDNSRFVHHRIFALQKTELLIKPIILLRLYYQYHSIDTDDLPILS